MIKRLVIIALIFIVIGVTGSVFTFKEKLVEKEIIEKEINVDEINHIDIIMSNAAVEISPTKSETAKIVFTGDTSKINFEEKIDQDTLYIFGKENRITLFNVDMFSFGQSLEVELPEKMYESIKVNTDNGKININNLEVGYLESKTANGTIGFNNIIAHDVQTRTYNGRVNMENIEGDIEAKSSNGKIDVSLKSLDQSLDLHTSNGAIKVVTKEEPTNTVIDAHTGNGSIRVFGKKDWDIVTGNGDNLVKLRTSNGSIKVEKSNF